jgi:hypothetical protein
MKLDNVQIQIFAIVALAELLSFALTWKGTMSVEAFMGFTPIAIVSVAGTRVAPLIFELLERRVEARMQKDV